MTHHEFGKQTRNDAADEDVHSQRRRGFQRSVDLTHSVVDDLASSQFEWKRIKVERNEIFIEESNVLFGQYCDAD